MDTASGFQLVAQELISPKQRLLIDTFFEETPILAGAPVVLSSGVMKNVYEKVSEIKALNLTEMDGKLKEIGAKFETKEENLSLARGTITGLQDAINKAYPDAPNPWKAYVAKVLGPVMRQTAQNIEQTLVYGSIVRKCFLAGKYKDMGATTGTVPSDARIVSVVVMNWKSGENQMLMDKAVGMSKELFKFRDLNKDWEMLASSDPTVNERLGRRYLVEGFFGAQIANAEQYAFAFLNINLDDASTYPTASQMDQALIDCRAKSATTAIYFNPSCSAAFMNGYKTSALITETSTSNLIRTYKAYDDIELVRSYNMPSAKGAEATLYTAIGINLPTA